MVIDFCDQSWNFTNSGTETYQNHFRKAAFADLFRKMSRMQDLSRDMVMENRETVMEKHFAKSLGTLRDSPGGQNQQTNLRKPKIGWIVSPPDNPVQVVHICWRDQDLRRNEIQPLAHNYSYHCRSITLNLFGTRLSLYCCQVDVLLVFLAM